MDGREEYPVCFIGALNSDFPTLCLLLNENQYQNRFRFIEWISHIELRPINMNIHEYMKTNNIESKVIYAFDNISQSTGKSKNSIELINYFKDNYFNLVNESFDFNEDDFDFEEEQPIKYDIDKFIMYAYYNDEKLCYICKRGYSVPVSNYQIWNIDERDSLLYCYTSYRRDGNYKPATQDDINNYLSLSKLNELLNYLKLTTKRMEYKRSLVV